MVRVEEGVKGILCEEVEGTLDRKTLEEWKKTRDFLYRPKGRTVYYISGKRIKLSQLEPTQLRFFGVEKKKYEISKKIYETKKLYSKEKKIKKLEKKIKIRKRKIKLKFGERKQMYRMTLAVQDLRGNLRIAVHFKYFSMKVQMWSGIYVKLKDNEERLKEELLVKLKKRVGWNDNWERWFDFEPHYSIDEVDYNIRLEGKVEFSDEFLGATTKRKNEERLIKAKGQDVPDWF